MMGPRMARVIAAGMPAIGVAGPACADPILEFPGAGIAGGTFIGDVSLGWSLTTNQAVTVVALDAFAPTGDGAVRLYDSSGNVLASATVTNSDPQEGSPILFYSQAISPVSLADGKICFIAQDTSANSTQVDAQVTGLTTGAAITYVGGVAVGGLGATPTSDAGGGLFSPGYFGPNFNIAAVPEPSTQVPMGPPGLAALVCSAASVLDSGCRRSLEGGADRLAGVGPLASVSVWRAAASRFPLATPRATSDARNAGTVSASGAWHYS